MPYTRDVSLHQHSVMKPVASLAGHAHPMMPHPLSVPAPQAPHPLGNMHPALASWLLMHAAAMNPNHAPPASGGGQTTLAATKDTLPGLSVNRIAGAANAGSLPSTKVTVGGRTYQKVAGFHPSAGKLTAPPKTSFGLSKVQGPSSLPDDSIEPKDSNPVDRTSDNRDESASVDRSVDKSMATHSKRSGLVNVAQRLYQKALEPKLKLRDRTV